MRFLRYTRVVTKGFAACAIVCRVKNFFENAGGVTRCNAFFRVILVIYGGAGFDSSRRFANTKSILTAYSEIIHITLPYLPRLNSHVTEYP